MKKTIEVNKATHEEWLVKKQIGDLNEIRGKAYVYTNKKYAISTIHNCIKLGKGNVKLVAIIMSFYADKKLNK